MTDASQAGIIRLDGRRRYAMGRLTTLFRVDGAATGERYAASKSLLDPGQTGVATHVHETNDKIFLVLDGSPQFLFDETWTPCPTGPFLRIPAGVLQDFATPGRGPCAFSAFSLGRGSRGTCRQSLAGSPRANRSPKWNYGSAGSHTFTAPAPLKLETPG